MLGDLGRGHRRQLVTLPTGTGKTVVFSELIRRLGPPALVLAHRDELLKQARGKLVEIAPELQLSVGTIRAAQNDVRSPIAVASIQTVSSPKRLAQLMRTYRVVVVDEAHHAAADTYRRVFDHVGDSELILGMTATPERHDNRDLSEVWPHLTYARGLLEMIRAGYLADLRGLRIQLGSLDLSSVKVRGGDYQVGALGRALTDAGAPGLTADAYVHHGEGRKGIVFCPTVELSDNTARELKARGIRAASISGDTPKAEREAKLAAFAAGRIRVMVNCAILTEGFDDPEIGVVLIARPTKSRIMYSQMVGRGVRLHPGKDDCLVLDLVGVSDELSLQSVPTLLGIDVKPGESAKEAAERIEREEAAEEAASRLSRVPTKADDVALLEFNREHLAWIEIGDRLVLPIGKRRQLLIHPDLAAGAKRWQVSLMYESPAGDRFRPLARDLAHGYAIGAAEDVVRRMEKSRYYNDGRAGWRGKPPTSTQIRKLAKQGVSLPEGATRGDVAEILERILADDRVKRLDMALANRSAA